MDNKSPGQENLDTLSHKAYTWTMANTQTNPDHECPICGGTLVLFDAETPQMWECSSNPAHMHVQGDCCDTVDSPPVD